MILAGALLILAGAALFAAWWAEPTNYPALALAPLLIAAGADLAAASPRLHERAAGAAGAFALAREFGRGRVFALWLAVRWLATGRTGPYRARIH